MISIKNLFLRYTREFFALYDINLDIEKGESVAFIGKEHSGKTSLIRALTKLESPCKGEIYIKGRPLKKVNFKTDINIGYIPFSPVFLEKKTVYENLKFILRERGFSEKEIESKINEAIMEYSLEKIRDEKVANLSLEEKYVLSFIRLTFRSIDLLIVDNIFDNLDKIYLEIIMDLIKKLKEKETILIVASTVEKLASSICKRKVYFKNGSMVSAEDFKTED